MVYLYTLSLLCHCSVIALPLLHACSVIARSLLCQRADIAQMSKLYSNSYIPSMWQPDRPGTPTKQNKERQSNTISSTDWGRAVTAIYQDKEKQIALGIRVQAPSTDIGMHTRIPIGKSERATGNTLVLTIQGHGNICTAKEATSIYRSRLARISDQTEPRTGGASPIASAYRPPARSRPT